MMRWFDRVFPRDVPAWMWPNLLERLRGTPARAEEAVHGVSPGALAHRHGQSWSIQENVGHLLDLEPLWSGRTEDFLESRKVLRPADLTNQKTHEAAHNAADVAGLLASFRRARESWVTRLEGLEPWVLERTAIHPRLQQPMTLVDLAYFVAEHDDHHLATITRCKRTVGDC